MKPRKLSQIINFGRKKSIVDYVSKNLIYTMHSHPLMTQKRTFSTWSIFMIESCMRIKWEKER